MPNNVSFGRPRKSDDAVAMRRPGSFHVEGQIWRLGKRWKITSKAGLWYKKFAILHAKVMHFYDDYMAFSEGAPSKVLNLERAVVERVDSSDGVANLENCFVISITEIMSKRKIYLAVSDEESRTHWVECMQDAAKKKDSRASRSMPDLTERLDDSATVIPDRDAVDEEPCDEYQKELNRKNRINEFIVQMADEERKQRGSGRFAMASLGGGRRTSDSTARTSSRAG